MEPTTIERSEVTIERSHSNLPLIRILQDGDLVVVEDDDIEEFVAAVKKHAGIIEDPKPTPHITAGGEDLRMTRMISRDHVQQMRRDMAYEEGRISVLDSMMDG